MFEIKSDYSPKGDQPNAIEQITNGFNQGNQNTTLLGATGTGKTFTMANIIQNIQKPTLIISHNKTLAAQLATEFKYFFPKNAVHYFVSYFDYYQPESYIPERDMYIEKDSSINKEIEMYRLSTMASLLSREDTIVVSSVSALYGLGSKQSFEENSLTFKVGEKYSFDEIKRQLISMQYKPVESKVDRGMFEFKGEVIDIYSSLENILYRLFFDEDELEFIQQKDLLTFNDLGNVSSAKIWPATQFLQNTDDLDNILDSIKNELETRVKELKDQGKEIEAQRLHKRTMYDIRMIKETGFVNGIENYSPYFDKRQAGEPPNTLFDYFPDDFLMIVDESHMTLPQLKAMPQADKSRKESLIQNGFRLPSAIDHRPINFGELETILGLGNTYESNVNKDLIKSHVKKNNKSLFVSATPAEYELSISDNIVEQIIRPTGLLDPKTYVYPKSGDYNMLMNSIDKLLKKKPDLKKYLSDYNKEIDLKNLFFE